MQLTNVLIVLTGLFLATHAGQEKYPSQKQAYSFGYDIKDGHGNNQMRHEESDADGNKKGSYGYTDAWGIYRVVDYVADHNGYRAWVRTNEPGTSNQNPASIKIKVEEPPQGSYKEQIKPHFEPEPSHYQEPEPAHYKNPEPVHYKNPEPVNYDEPEPVHYNAPAPIHYNTPASFQYKEPERYYKEQEPIHYRQQEKHQYNEPEPVHYRKHESSHYDHPESSHFDQPEPQSYENSGSFETYEQSNEQLKTPAHVQSKPIYNEPSVRYSEPIYQHNRQQDVFETKPKAFFSPRLVRKVIKKKQRNKSQMAKTSYVPSYARHQLDSFPYGAKINKPNLEGDNAPLYKDK